MNYIDTIIILVLLLYAADGWVRGLWDKIGDLVGFAFSFLLALRLYPLVADLLMDRLGLSRHFAKAVGLVSLTILMAKAIGLMVDRVGRLMERKNNEKARQAAKAQADSVVEPGVFLVEEHIEEKRTVWRGRLRRALAATVAMVDGTLMVTLALTFIVSFPLQPEVKTDVFKSLIGRLVVAEAAGFENRLTTFMGGIANESLTFLTLPPRKNESGSLIRLGISLPESRLAADFQAETAFLDLVKARRRNAGIPPFIISDRPGRLRDLAIQMFGTGWLYEPAEGYLVSLAPSAGVAVEGWLAVSEYRQILLDPALLEISVGVVDAGPYGKLFVVAFGNSGEKPE